MENSPGESVKCDVAEVAVGPTGRPSQSVFVSALVARSRSRMGPKSSKPQQQANTNPKRKTKRNADRRANLELQRLKWSEIPRWMAPLLLRENGDFLIRSELDVPILSVRGETGTTNLRFKASKKSNFKSLDEMVVDYYNKQTSVREGDVIVLKTPIYKTFEVFRDTRLTFGRELGAGAFGTVWKATLDQDKEQVAVKSIGGGFKEQVDAMLEVMVLAMVHHENVVRLRGLSYRRIGSGSSSIDELLIVMEYCDGGSLEKMLQNGTLNERGRTKALFDVAKGIKHLHEMNVVHRDLAARNCLVSTQSNGQLITKVADLGLSRRMVDDIYVGVTARMIPIYSTAPEALEHQRWNVASDIYAYGLLAIQVFNGGVNPYEDHFVKVGKHTHEQVAAVLKSGFRLPLPSPMPSPIAALVKQCLHGDMDKRPNSNDVVRILREYTLRQVDAA